MSSTIPAMSTRAVAPVVGVSQKTASRDVLAGESHDSPAPQPLVNTGDLRAKVAALVAEADRQQRLLDAQQAQLDAAVGR